MSTRVRARRWTTGDNRQYSKFTTAIIIWMDISKSYWLEQYTALQEAWEEMVADNMNRKIIRSYLCFQWILQVLSIHKPPVFKSIWFTMVRLI